MELGTLSPALILTLVVGLALAPYVAVMVTAFTKLVVVFSLLRNALGLQQTPPNVVLNGLAIILSAYVMYPVGLEMASAAQPIIEEQRKDDASNVKISELLTIAERAKEPLQRLPHQAHLSRGARVLPHDGATSAARGQARASDRE